MVKKYEYLIESNVAYEIRHYEEKPKKTTIITNKEKINRLLNNLLELPMEKIMNVADTSYICLKNHKYKIVINNKENKIDTSNLKTISKRSIENTIKRCKQFTTRKTIKKGVVLLSLVTAIGILGTGNFTLEKEMIPVAKSSKVQTIIENNTKETSFEITIPTEISNNNISYLNQDTLVGSYLKDENNLQYLEMQMQSELGKYITHYAQLFNINESLLAAISFQESNFKHNNYVYTLEEYEGKAIGAFQIEVDAFNGNNISAVDIHGQTHSIDVTLENANVLENNVLMASILMKNNIDKYQGNVLLATQAYNCGNGAVGIICSEVALESFGTITQETVNMIYKESITNSDLMNDIKNRLILFLNNPSIYMSDIDSRVIEANPNASKEFITKDNSFAHPQYLESVLGKVSENYINSTNLTLITASKVDTKTIN